MRRIALVSLTMMLGGCGYHTWWNPPFTYRLQSERAGHQQREHGPGDGSGRRRDAADDRTGRYLARSVAAAAIAAGPGDARRMTSQPRRR